MERSDSAAAQAAGLQIPGRGLPWRGLLAALALGCLVGVGWVSFRAMNQLAEADHWEKHSSEVILKFEQLMSTMKDAETGQRGFLLTGREDYLEPYTRATVEVDKLHKTLMDLTADNPAQQQRLSEIASLTQARMQILERIMEIRRTQGFEAAVKVVRLGQSKAIMDAVRQHIASAQAEEERLLAQRTATKIHEARLTARALSAAGLVSGCLLLGILIAYYRENAQRHRYAHALQQQQVNLEHLVQMRTAELGKSEARLKTLIEHVPAALAMFDRQMRYLAASSRWQEDYRLGKEDFLGRSHYELFPETPERWKEAYRRGMAGEVLRGDAERLERADGSVQWITWEIRPWHDETGAVGGIGIFSKDISERVQFLEALQRSRELLSLIIDTAPALISYIDPDFRYRLLNQTYHRWFGRPTEQLFGQSVREVVGEAAWEKVRPWMERAMAGEAVSYEEELPYAVGGPRWVSVNLMPDKDEEGHVRGIVALVIDITDRKQAEQGLAVQRQRLAGIVDSAMDAIISIDARQRIVLFNVAAEQMFQCPAREALGASIERFIPARFTSAHAEHIRRFGETGDSRRTMGRLGAVYGLRANGQEFPIEASISQIEVNNEKLYTVILRDISARVAAEEEIRRMNAELEARVESRTAELREANQELETFAYAVSHDLRAPLRAINGFAKILAREYGGCLDEGGKQYLDYVVSGAQRMGELIEGLLQLSRSSRGEIVKKTVNLSALARRIMEELALTEPDRQVHYEIEDGLEVEGDPRMLEALMHNLLGNAWKYTAKVAKARIRFYLDHSAAPPRFCVEDNGAGFDMAHADKLFQPFRRLHGQDEFSGIGIGLATVKRVVQRHGGEISAEAKPGKGACFHFTLAG